jgi:mannose-6-phosphate isomerase-like protein (cupin superfamily)
MSVRRVVTGLVDGKSAIIDDGPVPESQFWQEIWVSSPDEPLGHAPSEADGTLEPSPGAARWRVFLVPPDEVLRSVMAEHYGGDVGDDAFFHITNTLDMVFVLEGEITLRMEDGEVLLQPGDCVVQRGTNHAWRNTNATPVKLLGVMTALPPEAEA